MSRYLFALLTLLFLASPLHAQEMPMMPKMDDRVVLDLESETWVTTKTARVVIGVEASVSGTNAGSMRSDMQKALGDVAKGDWRLTSFNRSQDQTGLERWSASFEARLPETELNGLNDAAKKVSKAGMQVTVSEMDFSPTLDEMEAARASVRAQIYKSANDQLAALNAALPGKGYRIALIDFTNDAVMAKSMRARNMDGNNAVPMAMMATAQVAEAPMERAEKITQRAHVVLSAMPAPPALDIKH